MSTNIVRNNPAVMAAIQKNILEHISLMAQEQVQLEFREQMQQMMMMQQQAATNPQIQAQLQALTNQVESRKATLNRGDDRRIYEGRETNYITI